MDKLIVFFIGIVIIIISFFSILRHKRVEGSISKYEKFLLFVFLPTSLIIGLYWMYYYYQNL